MRVYLFTIGLLSILLSACGRFSHSVSSEEGNFSINFPNKPSENTRNIETESGPMQVTMYSCISSDSMSIFILSYNDIPTGVPADPDTLMKKSIIGPAQAMRTSIVEDKKLELDGYPGYYFKCLGLDIAMIYHFYVVEDRMFQIAILNKEPREPSAAEIKQFMGSFKLLKKK